MSHQKLQPNVFHSTPESINNNQIKNEFLINAASISTQNIWAVSSCCLWRVLQCNLSFVGSASTDSRPLTRVWNGAEYRQELRLVKNTRFLAADEVGKTHEPFLSFCHSVFFCARLHTVISNHLNHLQFGCVFMLFFQMHAADGEGFFPLVSHSTAVTTVCLTVCSSAKVNFSRWFTLARIPAHYRGKQWLLTVRGSKRTSVSMDTAAH